jgi:hypothetical protein
MLTGTTAMPTKTVGDLIQFGGGTVTPILNDLVTLFNNMKVLNDPEKGDSDNDPNTWTTSVVVYEDNNICINPTGEYRILGFATLTITGIITTGNNKGPVGVVQCNISEEERGGCFYAGTYGSIAGLVQ